VEGDWQYTNDPALCPSDCGCCRKYIEPTPALTPAFICHNYEGQQNDDWCRETAATHRIENGFEYEFGQGVVSSCGCCSCCKRAAEVPLTHSADPDFPPVLMTMLPWFTWDNTDTVAPKASGWHWKMDNLVEGPAAHYPPLSMPASISPLNPFGCTKSNGDQCGMYSSNDPLRIQYQIELMLTAGVPGIVLDWYGARDLNDYHVINSNAIIDGVSAAGMVHAIMYEDWVLDPTIPWGSSFEAQGIDVLNPQSDPQKQLRIDMAYIRDQYMSKPGYLTEDKLLGNGSNRPIILIFGPRILKSQQAWDDALAAVWPVEADRPYLVSIDGAGVIPDDEGGNFHWISGMTPTACPESDAACEDAQIGWVEGNHTNFYNHWDFMQSKWIVGSIYSGFKDFYVEGSGGTSYGTMPDYEGRTFDKIAEVITTKKDIAHFTLAATWNDYQEGTQYEPSENLPYSSNSPYARLLSMQKFTKGYSNEGQFAAVTNRYHQRVAEHN